MFKYGQIIEYIDSTYDENFNNALAWCRENFATFDELIDRRVEKDGVLHRFFEIRQIPIYMPSGKERTLEELKLIKRAEINRARDAAEQGGFEYLGKTFDSDQVSCLRMASAAQAMALAPEESSIVWTCQDNTTISLNKEQLVGLVVALAQHSNACHQKATTLKAEIDKAKSKEELDKIVWID